MPGIEALDELVREQRDDVQFRVVDPNKRSRFHERDLIKLVQIVTRRKTYKTPHGKGEEGWQAVADQLNEAVTASFSLRACRDKLSALGRQTLQLALLLVLLSLLSFIEAGLELAEKRRKAKALGQERSTAPEAPDDEEHAVQHDASEAESAASDERTGLRRLLGSEYSSDEETKQGDNEESDQTEEDNDEEENESGHKVGRTRLRVSEIWAREEAMMAKDRAAQAARDNALTKAVETLANTTHLLLQHFGGGSANRSSAA
ncbi:hypothetical protein PHYSODRAFT_306677 [Phytophthora sojae]|uniref:Uncharacterized protein n=1 Tax=Phytophthora sojae (strain P6497) TaxID=1094619 RepID=G5AAA5_PHYSP|nr:hypothetical protein PHYSODRAFT_306677 [Phytophthora sojae]EGZ07534.1 hypothetical protein PHYSODRAFT_306677 [Phytophthora sojae]|eukprot:XP_009537100.1 hypothetical protein PHYSODRAFT_306677 [Phytophthora sojae]